MMTAQRSTSVPATLWTLAERAIAGLNALQPAAQLAARCYVAAVFFRSGLTKLQDWDTTLALFVDEYHVPLLHPTLAAWLGTAAEVGLPVLLVLGLTGRVAAAGLFVLNAVAVLSLADIAPAALQQHVFWGSLLAALLLWGPGGWSVDRFAVPWLRRRLLGHDGSANRYTAAASPTQM
jgi:putative oxidoreductase